jgi:hypothetical protein
LRQRDDLDYHVHRRPQTETQAVMQNGGGVRVLTATLAVQTAMS